MAVSLVAMKRLEALRDMRKGWPLPEGAVLVDLFRDLDIQWRVLTAMPLGHPLRDHLGGFRYWGWVK